MKKILSFLFFLAILGLFCLYAVMAIRPSDGSGVQLTEVEAPAPAQLAPTADLSALARAFEHVFPYLPDQPVSGRITTEQLEGRNARVLTLSYPDLTVTCVWPASAAPLLLRPELTLYSLWADDRYRYSLLSMPCVYAEADSARCLYFSDESAAYRVDTSQLARDAFLAEAQRLTWYR